MKFESSKCTIICSSKVKVGKDDIKFCRRGGGEIKKATSATYFGLAFNPNKQRDERGN